MRSFVCYGGKGGVGKTTLAAATGVAAAQRGEKTLVVSTDPAHSLADAFDVEPADSRTGVDENLWIEELSPEAGEAAYRALVDVAGCRTPVGGDPTRRRGDRTAVYGG